MSSKSNAGMTLIEVMVAMFILATMTFMLQQIIGSSLDGKDRVEKRDAMVHEGRVATRRLVTDLANAFSVAATPAMVGSKGGNPVIETRFRGESGSGQDKLSFTSFSHLRYIKNSRESDQVTLSYFLEPDTEDRDNLRLMRREVTSIDVGAGEKGAAYPLANHIKAFTLKYLDVKANEWRSDWDSNDPTRLARLPRAVKIQLEMIDPRDKENILNFSTIALISLWQNPIDF